MRNARRSGLVLFAASLAVLATASFASAQSQLEELLASVVRIKTFINPDGRTVSNLGREREGSGIVIDDNGLILTIGYLMVEAHGAEVVDQRRPHAAGDRRRLRSRLRLRPAADDRAAQSSSRCRSASPRTSRRRTQCWWSAAATGNVAPVRVAAKREFAGSWEYLLDEAIFTTPPFPSWSGAALISREGKLVGVGSLIVGDATADQEQRRPATCSCRSTGCRRSSPT